MSARHAVVGLALALFASAAATAPAAADEVRVVSDAAGMRLVVDGRPLMVRGMNWGYTPRGENYRYDLWGKPDDFVREALDRDMALLRGMGVNAIRIFSDIPPRWVRYIHETYGIYTVVNHLLGRYGFSIDGSWVAPVDYGDAHFRDVVLADLQRVVERYRGTPGVLFYLLGNENNYGLEWPSAEIAALPPERRDRARATKLYELMGEAVARVKAADPSRPVAIANGDLQYLDLIKSFVLPKGLDILGANVYRGPSAGDVFARVGAELGLPFVFTEIGADAYDAKREREDDLAQARYLRAQWQEIDEQSAGKGGAGNAIGGFVFQWADGWWKYRQETNLDVHDTHASWPDGGFAEDFEPDRNNMNEEWFGICALGPTDARGFLSVTPRTAYYVLREGFRLDPYADGVDRAAVVARWSAIHPEDLAVAYRAARAAEVADELGRFRVRDVRLDLRTYTTGGDHLDDAAREGDGRFDHQEAVFVELEARPVDRVRARATVALQDRVAQNPIDEIFYRAPVKLYAASVEWDEALFALEAFYRTGHGHWGYEGDAFGLYPEAYYGAAVDTYNADAPIGLALTGKRELEGLRLAFGPALWWGANPAVIGTYRRAFGPLTLTLVHHEDVAAASGTVTSSAVPEAVTRRTSLALETHIGALRLDVAGLVSGTPKLGDTFWQAEATSDPTAPSYAGSGQLVTRGHIEAPDTLGAKVKLSGTHGAFHGYLQGGYRGLVADGGGDWTVTYTGWSLKEAGRGNHWAVSGGAAIDLGYVQLAPNVLYQRPLVGPMPTIPEAFDLGSGTYYPGFRARSIIDSPFAVLDNRELFGAELLVVYDPTPGTWLWAWDNELVEDAPLAASLDLVYRHQPTSRDASLGFTEDGVLFAFPGAPPAADLWEASARIIARPGAGARLRARLWAGTGQARGDDARTVLRGGADLRATWERLTVEGFVKIADWGPYDYHRDFNMTFPLQLMLDLSWSAAAPEWLGRLMTRVGLRGQLRTLDARSNRFAVDPDHPERTGHEWELMTYLQTSLGGAP